MSDIKKLRHRCFFDITIGDRNVGRIVFELFNDICPKTCENFKSLCTGESGIGKMTGKPLHYKNVIFHRVVKSFIIQSGDFSMGNGRGGESIYGGTFNDESFDIKHDKPFLLSMANRGKNTNGSQFFITLAPAPHLDGVHVVFGHALSGQDIIEEIANQQVDHSDCKPLVDVVISNCGELIPQIITKEKKKRKKEKVKKSDGELSSDDDERSNKTKSKKDKKHKQHRKEKNKNNEEKTDDAIIQEENESTVKAEEIPEIPANNFLMRRIESEKQNSSNSKQMANISTNNYERKTINTRSGRKVKGRGVRRYLTPSPENQRSGSETPPHWRTEQSRLKSLKDIVSMKQRSDERDYRRSERSRFDSRRNYKHRDEDSYSNRESFRRDRFEKNISFDNLNKESTTRKRVFTEEPQTYYVKTDYFDNRSKRVKDSVSPNREFDRQLDENNANSKIEDTAIVSQVMQMDLIKYPENKEIKYLSEKYPTLKSNVTKVIHSEIEPEMKKRHFSENNSSKEKRNDRNDRSNEKRMDESLAELEDIPLPNINQSLKNDKHQKSKNERLDDNLKDLESKNNKPKSSKDSKMHSRDRAHSSHKKESRNRRNSSSSSRSSSSSQTKKHRRH